MRSREHYLELLDSLPLKRRLDEATMRRAKKYAYHFFFRRMVPLGVVKPTEGKAWATYAVDVSSLDELKQGRDAGLDTICDGILHGSDFIYPAEKLRRPGMVLSA